ncbi:c-type cytochrome [Luteolibacter pohnpeiensis]|uniref:C-type cytochrome n=1 Tax=Luteolibacter pohnpeiensis TaxID=454153 RepID=A0A934VTH1_9BACT|nr:PVC-type heme-binding CxxCH protein [Luteolibacter pohnpeiensis]MBK1881482.1 c-type cytochrome [Luteolibacter pohnpeiensis]
MKSPILKFLPISLWSIPFAALTAETLKPPVIGAQKDGLAPAEAAANFTTYEGFKIVQSAAEPDVRQPVAMTLDERGRVWIAEAYEYPKRANGDVGKDRILIFEDTDGDGVFDDRKVFAEGLNLVSGLAVGFGGVWVGAAPYLLYLPDSNHDDKADGKPEVVLDGFGLQDTHETLNSFIWGPDGWLYGCHGVFTHSKVGKPGTPDSERIPINAGVWRFHPISKKFEIFAQGTSNPWGLDFNDHGQAFVTACVIPHLYHIIQGGRYQRQAGQHFDPHTYDDIKTCADHLHYRGDIWANSRDGSSSDLGGGHAHCGLSIYLGDNFPDQFRDKLLFNNLHGHRVNQDAAVPSGSGFIGKHQPDFLFSNDAQHMGITLHYGPDGGLFLTDWYDSQICHNVDVEIWNRTNGRIYKITYGNPKSVSVNLQQAPDLELVANQLQKNDWYVRESRRLLQERAAAGALDFDQVVPALQQILKNNPDDTRRLRALWALHVIGKLDQEQLLKASEDPSEYVRAWSIQLSNESQPPGKRMLERWQVLAKEDPSPVVRLYLASALQRIPLEQRWELAAALNAHPEDADDHNLPLMNWYGVSDLAELDPDCALSLALNSSIPTVRQLMVRRLCESAEGRNLVISKTTADHASDILTGAAMALSKQRNLDMPDGWQQAAGIFQNLTTPANQRDFEMLATIFGDQRMSGKFRSTLADKSAPAADRKAALQNLRRMNDTNLTEILLRAAEISDDPLRGEWIQALALSKDERIPAFLIDLLPKLNSHDKAAAVQTLASTETGAVLLAKGLSQSTIKRGEISAFAARQMRSYDNSSITAAIEKYWGVIADQDDASKAEEIKKLATQLSPDFLATADVRKGRQLFQATCFACHQLFGEGMKIGPDLTGSNRADTNYLLENIVAPSSLVGVDYQLHTIRKTDGSVIAGMLREQSDSSLVLAVIGGNEITIPMDEIADHQISSTSMMPEGLLANLSTEEARDLIGYLQSPQQVPLPVPGEIIIGDQDLKVAELNRGVIQQQSMATFKADQWSGGTQLWWQQGQPGDRAILRFPCEKPGNYEVFAVLTEARDYAKIRISLNGEPGIDSFDGFHQPEVITSGEISLGTHEIKADGNELVLKIIGANPQAVPAYMAGIDHLRLAPVH